MGIIDSLLGSGLDPETDKLANGLLRKYAQFQMTEKAGSGLLDYMTGAHNLEDEDMKLGIALKKRALGMQDSDDYDDSRNNNMPLYARIGRHLIQQTPSTSFDSPKNLSNATSILEPFFKIARSVPHGSSRPGFISRVAGIL